MEDASLDGLYAFMADAYKGNWLFRFADTPYLLDVVVATHFIAASVLARYREEQGKRYWLGVTLSEGLARGVPMMLVDPIPGQEEANAAFALEHGFAKSARNLPALLYKLRALLENPEERTLMSQRARACAKPDAAMTVAAHALATLSENSAMSYT